MNLRDQAWRVAEAFQLPGAITCVKAHNEGLIHDTFVVSTDGEDGKFILQRINQHVFANPSALMDNIERVASHVQKRAIQSGRDPRRNAINLIQTCAGQTWHEYDGQAWRMFRYVEGTMTIDQAPTVEQASEIGKAFGSFLDDLSDFPMETLRTILPGYRDTKRYLTSLREAAKQDPFHRAEEAGGEIALIESRTGDATRIQDLLQSGQIPLRVIHGDTKLNNVLLDAETGDHVCVIDLDTVMPGLLLHDIGDCVREALADGLEHQDSLNSCDLQVFETIVAGFLSQLSIPPAALEIANIVAAVKSIALELGARFLTDFLSGDVYFKTLRSRENLLRAQQQIHLFRVIEDRECELQSIVHQCAS